MRFLLPRNVGEIISNFTKNVNPDAVNCKTKSGANLSESKQSRRSPHRALRADGERGGANL